MTMYCPQCMGPLTTQNGKTAVCTIHHGQFQILYARNAAVPPPLPSANVAPEDFMPADFAPSPASTIGAPSAPAVVSSMCRLHPDAPAVAHCRTCAAPVCATCDFVFPGDIHLCPSCATKPQQAMSGKRKKLLVWSYVLAGFSIALFVLTVTVVISTGNDRDAQALDTVLTQVMLFSLLVGTALGWGSMDKRLGNNGWVWGAALLNTGLLALLIVLMLVSLGSR